jgi:hypothetical protein
MRPLDLSPGPDLFAHELGKPAAREPEGPSRAGQRIARWLHRDAGRRNVALGRTPPALFTLLRRVQRRFAPTEAVVPERLRHAGREYIAAYRAGIDAFNRMGSPLPLDDHDVGKVVTPPRILEGHAAINKGVRSKGHQQLVTEICVEAPPGQHPTITTQRRSGSRALDRLARRAMERAVAAAPVPADSRGSRACYRFEVDYGRNLPTPDLSCIFALFTGKCSWPGARFFQHRVGLVAAWPR